LEVEEYHYGCRISSPLTHSGVLVPVELPASGSNLITTSLPPGVLLLNGSSGTSSPTPTSCHLDGLLGVLVAPGLRFPPLPPPLTGVMVSGVLEWRSGEIGLLADTWASPNDV